MSKRKQIKTKSPAEAIPTTREGAEQLLADIGKAQAKIDGAVARAKARALQLQLAVTTRCSPLNEEIDAKFQALFTYAQAHRGELLKGGAKTVKLATGELSWRFTPPRVEIKKGKSDEQLHELLDDSTYEAFVRTTYAINKEAILEAHAGGDEELVGGLSFIEIKQTEEFVAKPNEIVQEYVETVETVKPVKGGAK